MEKIITQGICSIMYGNFMHINVGHNIRVVGSGRTERTEDFSVRFCISEEFLGNDNPRHDTS